MAEEHDDSQKTEEATPRKLEEAREKGQTPSSREINTWFILAAGGLSVAYILPQSALRLLNFLKNFIEKADLIIISAHTGQQLTIELTGNVLKSVSLFFLALMVGALVGAGVQTGFLATKDHLKPKFERISPHSGIKRMFSAKSLIEFLKGILKITLVGSIAAMILTPVLKNVDQLIWFDVIQLSPIITDLVRRLFLVVVTILAIIAAGDYFLQRMEFNKRMRMTRHEVKEEIKQSEGDPHIRAKLKQLRTERARKRMMAAVPKASVVITNPTHYSIALEYDEATMEAPKVIAKGMDLIALRMREVAQEHEVPLVENPPLARTLYAEVDLDEQIHPEHYQAVAEVIRYVMNLKSKPLPPFTS